MMAEATTFLYRWQELLGAAAGAAAPFVLWWLSQAYARREKRAEDLYYLQRLVVDQINLTIEARQTLKTFLDMRIPELIRNIGSNPESAYSVEWAFLPMFSIRSMPDDLHRIVSGSSYVDNLVAHAFKISKDFPHMIEDVQRQFSHGLQINKELALAKSIDPTRQKEAYIRNLQGFEGMVRRQVLDANFAAYISVLVRLRAAVDEFRRIGRWRWKMRFELHFKFFKNYAAYKAARGKLFDAIERALSAKVDEGLREVEDASLACARREEEVLSSR